MDDRELEDRLRSRLHARFDDGAAPARLRASVRQSLASDPRPRTRTLSFASWSGRLVAAAAVVVIAVVALTLRGGSVPPGGPSPSPSALPTASASASPSASAGPSASASPTASPPASPAATSSPSTGPSAVPVTGWTGLSVRSLVDAPVEVQTVIPWTRGYLAVGPATASGPTRSWTSQDGRAWTVLPASTFGLDSTDGSSVVSGVACGDGILVETTDAGGVVTLWSTTDGTTWTPTRDSGVEAGQLASTGTTAVAAGESGTIAASPGLHVELTTDCTTWRRVDLPGPSRGLVSDVAAFGGGFVAVGYSTDAQGLAVAPLAWLSADGSTWTAATVAERPGDGFGDVWAASGGLIAASSQPGLVPGLGSLWTSADGRTWTRTTAGPLGTIAEGEGVGSDAGQYAGDGQRLIAYGTPDGGAGPAVYRTSLDGTHWTTLAMSGDAASSVIADQAEPFLLSDGVLFSGPSGSAVGDATGG